MILDISKLDSCKTPYFGVNPHIKVLDHPLKELAGGTCSIRLSSSTPYNIFVIRKSLGATMSALVPVSGSL